MEKDSSHQVGHLPDQAMHIAAIGCTPAITSMVELCVALALGMQGISKFRPAVLPCSCQLTFGGQTRTWNP